VDLGALGVGQRLHLGRAVRIVVDAHIVQGQIGELGDPGVQPWVPVRNISWAWAPQPWTIPGGCLYQSCMADGRPLTKRAMMVEPTLSPKAWINPPPPFGAGAPCQETCQVGDRDRPGSNSPFAILL